MAQPIFFKQSPSSTLAELASHLEELAPAEEIAFRDVGDEPQLVQRAEAPAHAERAGGLLLDLHVQIDRVRIDLLRNDLDRLEVVQVLETLVAALHGGSIDQLGLIDPQLAADHLVAGLVVAGDVDGADANQGPFLDLEGDRGVASGIAAQLPFDLADVEGAGKRLRAVRRPQHRRPRTAEPGSCGLRATA